MNLRKIIQESINNVIYQNIISEAIDEVVNERQKFGRKGRNATNRQPKPTNNLQSVRKQNARQQQTQNTQNTRQPAQGTQQPQQPNPQNTQQPNPQTQPQQPNQQPQQQQPNQQPQQQRQKPDYTQYAEQIKQLIGKGGIDPSPVKTNEAAVKHIEELNNFLFDVLDAIYDGNVTPQDTANIRSGNGNGYGRTLGDAFYDGSSGIVNYLGNNAERAMQATPGLNQIMGGVFGAGVNAYNKTHNQFARSMDNRQYANGYSRPGGVHSITPLTQLFAPSGEFNRLYTNYQQINTANGNILNNIREVPQIYGILNNLGRAVNSSANQQTQTQQPQSQQQQQPQTGQQPNNTGGTPQPGNTPPATPNNGANQQQQQSQTGQQPNNTGETPQPGNSQNSQQQNRSLTRYHWFVDGVMNLDPNGEKLNEIIDKIEENGINSKVKKHLIDIIKWIGEKSDNVAQSIETNSVPELIYLINNFGENWERYNEVRQKQEYRILNNKIIHKTMELLNMLYNDMKQHGFLI